MAKAVESIVIVGGGTAGWITAGTIASQHASKQENGLSVTLVESPDIKPIGVGEGTWPTMRSTLKKMGISETEFFRECDASFKQGAKFAKWVDGSEEDYYYHPLMLPTGFSEGNLAPYWQLEGGGRSFSDAVCFQEALCERNLAPKNIVNREYDAVANYAYHLNAAKFSEFLKRHCIDNLGVKHVSDNVISINNDESGYIESITGETVGSIAGDLFVDCTGFKSLLLGQHYDVPFIDKSDVLFVDRAIAAQVPYMNENDEVVPYTVSTGQSAGWIWDIGLQSRRGVGHVYSSRHTNEEAATEELIRYIEPSIGREAASSLNFRSISIQPGHREKFWHKNCVAVGLSAGFLEPLEASALVLVELSASMLSEQMPTCREAMPFIARRFNDTFRYRWDRIIDFLKLHYVLTKRDDEPFWRDNKNPETIPKSLSDLLELWQYQHPWDHDFTSKTEVFPAASYQYVLYGMGFKTRQEHIKLTDQDINFGESKLRENYRLTQKVLSAMPGNRELLNKIAKYGFQRI